MSDKQEVKLVMPLAEAEIEIKRQQTLQEVVDRILVADDNAARREQAAQQLGSHGTQGTYRGPYYAH